jgi:hypothetical protein
MDQAPGADGYPRTYRYAPWVLVLGPLMGLFFLGIAFVGSFALWRSSSPPPSYQLPLILLGLLVPAALGGWCFIGVFRSKLVLTADAVEVHGAFRVRRMARADIAGRRTQALQYGQQLTVLRSRDPRAPELKISQSMRTDATWNAWLAALPDLDAQAARDLEAEVAANPELGQTPEERLARLAAARKLARSATFVTYAVAAWAYFYPRPYGAALLAVAALPWLAIVLVARSRGLLRIDSQRNDPRPSLALAVILPGIALLMRSLTDVGMFELWYVLAYAALVAGLITWAALTSDAALRARPWAALLLCAVAGCPYGYGAVVLGNAELDHSAGTDYRVAVLERHMSRGGRSTYYYLLLGRWGARTEPAQERVPRDLYLQAAPGSSVCIHRGAGALAIPWYVVRSCDASHG